MQPVVELNARGPEEGCGSIVWGAVGEEVGKLVEGGKGNGEYFEPVGVRGKVGRWGEDGEMAERLWGWSEGVLRRDGFL